MVAKKKTGANIKKLSRDAKTGLFVTAGYAKKHPATTVVESIRKPRDVKPVIPTPDPPPKSKKR